MRSISRIDIENIGCLVDPQLQNVLVGLCSTWRQYNHLIEERDVAQDGVIRAKEAVESDVEHQTTATGERNRLVWLALSAIIEIIVLINAEGQALTYLKHQVFIIIGLVVLAGVLFLFSLAFPVLAIGLTIIAIIVALSSVPVLLSKDYISESISSLLVFASFIHALGGAPRAKTEEERKILLAEAEERHSEEIQNAEDKLADCEKQLCDYCGTEAYRALYSFWQGKGEDLSLDELDELCTLVQRGKANTFAEARQLQDQQRYNQEMKKLAEDQAGQERKHHEELIREEKRHHKIVEQGVWRTAYDTNRVAKAEEERLRIEKDRQSRNIWGNY